MSLRRFLSAVLLLTITALAVIVYLFPNNTDFYQDNRGWNGFSNMAAAAGISVTAVLNEITPPFDDRMIILVPNVSPGPDELAGLRDFVNSGGYLVIADDFGTGNMILEHLGLNARFSYLSLLDPVICYQHRAFPIVLRFTQHPLTRGLSEIVLNHPTAITGVDEAGVLAWSSSFSFQDADGDGVKGAGEPFGPFPVMAELEYGAGRILLLSDPSIFINAGYALKDNARLLDNLTTAAAEGVYFDPAFLSPSPLTDSKDFLTSARDWLRSPPGTAISVIAALAAVWFLWQPGSRVNKPKKEGE